MDFFGIKYFDQCNDCFEPACYDSKMKSSISSSNSSLGFVNLFMEFNFIIFILQINLGL